MAKLYGDRMADEHVRRSASRVTQRGREGRPVHRSLAASAEDHALPVRIRVALAHERGGRVRRRGSH